MDIREKLEILRHKLAGMISAAVEPCDEGECCESCKYLHSTACTDYLIADYMIANGVTVQEWIPVSEPPEEDGRYFVARYDYVTKTPFTDILWFERGQWWNRLHCGNFAVTHWMPMPPLPKGE